MKKVIQFMYCGQANKSDLDEQVLIAANKYQLEELKKACEMQLYKKVNISNCVDLLLLSDMHEVK